MDLFNSFRVSNDEPEYWVMLDQTCLAPDLLPLAGFRNKLDRALNDLGRLDYDLKTSLSRLCCDLTAETHGHLHGYVSEIVQPELAKAISGLEEAITMAKSLTDEVISLDSGHKQ